MAAPSAHSEFDYVIVGAGMAGSVLANRLTADGRSTVCVLEAGPPDYHPFIHIPGGFIKMLMNPKYTWQFQTEPSEGTAGRRLGTVQGRTLGGSSSINGFNYNRGLPLDFDTWAQKGNRGWGYADVLPYFKRSERRIGAADSQYRGSEGLLPISDGAWHHPLCDAFIEGASRMGIPRNPDYNGESQAGVGYYQTWIKNGLRVSTARAFLRPAMKRANLEVRTRAQATAILFQGKSAVGVSYKRDADSEATTVRARREVILCAGTANTTKLLQISGVGPTDLLGSIGVPMVHELPGVGKNLQDHYSVRLVARVKGIETINTMAHGIPLLRQIAKWALGRPSMLATSPSVAYGFWKSRDELEYPDLQLLVTPGSYVGSVPGLLDTFGGMTVGFYQQRPISTGYVHARSADPFDFPVIQPNYLAAESDRRVVVDGIKLMRRLMRMPELQPYIEREEAPGDMVQSDDELLDFARKNGSTAYHLVSTCRMGLRTDPTAVVDDELRVHGMKRLRIVDASIMPNMPSANTGASTLMIAEKGADLIMGRPPLPAAVLGEKAA